MKKKTNPIFCLFVKVRKLDGIEPLVKLFNSPNQEVRRYATGAMRNVIYENRENKVVLIDKQGIPELVKALNEPDDELHKNITGREMSILAVETVKASLEYGAGTGHLRCSR